MNEGQTSKIMLILCSRTAIRSAALSEQVSPSPSEDKMMCCPVQAQNSPSTTTWNVWETGRPFVSVERRTAAASWASGRRYSPFRRGGVSPRRRRSDEAVFPNQNNPPSEDKGRKRRGHGKRKKKVVVTKEREDECFSCGDGGQMVSCKKPGCPKVYHADCLNLTKRPAGRSPLD